MKRIVLLLFGIIFATNLHCLNVSVIGTGYVGLTLGACLAEFGNRVICADIDKQKIEILNHGDIPSYEPGLKELVDANRARGLLTFSDDPEAAIRETDLIFIAVGTPMGEDGKADLRAIESVAKMVGKNLNDYKVICTKSTVPIGTGKKIKKWIKKHAESDASFDVASNPEFLKEGTAVHDFIYPDRVVIGAETEKARAFIKEAYAPLLSRNVPFLCTDIASAETIKYAANAFLATKISFINEMSALCESTGADIKTVALGMGLDSRIGNKFLNPGPGFGGSCFPKDSAALIYKARSCFQSMKIVDAALAVNDDQKRRMVKKLSTLLGDDFEGKTVALLGLAFKANTDDIRYSPSLVFIDYLLEHDAKVKVYDPVAMANMKKMVSAITYCDSAYDAVRDADAVVILTEWDEFRSLDLSLVKALMKKPVILDARNILSTKKLNDLAFITDNIGNAHVA